MCNNSMTITYDDVVKARETQSKVIRKTTLEFSETFSKICGANVYLKNEYEQKLVNGEEGCLCNIDLEFVDNGAKQGLVDATLIDEKNKILIKQNITRILDVVLENNS